jgi:hypothetical protein
VDIELSELLNELNNIYTKSDISKYCLGNGHKWSYSLVTSTLEKNGPLVIGFNWGASKGEEYEPQTEIKKANFLTEDVGSLSRIYPFCRKHFGDDFISKITQSNYCFFRSHNESQISSKDIELCEPIFEKLISIIEPSIILCFSSKLRNSLLRNGKIQSLEKLEIEYYRGSFKMTYCAIKATLNSGIKINFLPHPNYPIKGEARIKAWDFCCGQITSD